MNRFFISSAIAAITAISISGCGSASSNDQGVSVLSLGYFSAGPQQQAGGAVAGGSVPLPAGLAGAIIQVCSGRNEFSSTLQPGGAGETAGGSFVGWVGFENNLTQVGVSVDRVDFRYTIPGAEMQPPTTSVPVSITLGPFVNQQVGAVGAAQPGFTSSLPPGFRNLPNRGFSQTFLIPASIRSWICLNKESLPLRPFQLEVTSEGRYRTTAGDFQKTNDQTIIFEVIDEVPVLPTDGTDDTTPAGSLEVPTSDAAGIDQSELVPDELGEQTVDDTL